MLKKLIALPALIFLLFLVQLQAAHATKSADEVVTRAQIQALAPYFLRQVDVNGRATKTLQIALDQFESQNRRYFDEGAAHEFQALVARVGAKMSGPISIPENNTPYWLADPGPLDNFRSTKNLPAVLDYLVIGAGLTGASAALELGAESANGKTVAVFEAGPRPAFGASGRNGGNIEMIKENFLNDYRGFVEVQKDILKSRYPDLNEAELVFQSKRQSEFLLRFFQENVRLVEKTVKDHSIQADVSMKGWLRMAVSKEEERGLKEEVEFAKKLGLEFEIWSAKKITETYGIPAEFDGRFIKKSGNYHPFKYVNGVLDAAIKKNVKLYTGTKVVSVKKLADGRFAVLTNEGEIIAKKIVVATNAYTSAIFPELSGLIEPRVSHIVNVHHTLNKLQGITFTTDNGDFYANMPMQDHTKDEAGNKRGTLHAGGGLDTPIRNEQVSSPPFLKKVFNFLMGRVNHIFPDTKGRPPVASWSGVMAFFADRAPMISFMYRQGEKNPDKGIVFALACNGYGGSQAIAAGTLAAKMAVTGQESAALPRDIFSMERLLKPEPLFERRPRTLHGRTCAQLF